MTFHSHDNTGKLLPGTIGASALQRQWIGLSAIGDETTVEPLPTPPHPSAPPYLESIDIEVGFMRRGAQATEVYNADEMTRNFVKAFNGIVFAPGQLLVFEFHGQNLKALVKGVGILELADEQRMGGQQGRRQDNMGILMDKSDVGFLKAGDSPIKIKSSSKK
jgi:vesicle-fusing ATPase